MNKVFRTILLILILCTIPGYGDTVRAKEDEDIIYSLLFSYKTGGSPELLAKKANALGQLKTPQSLAISFGSVLGPTRIVENDNGARFLRTAYQGGLDLVVPAQGEFIFGVDTFRILTEFSGMAKFISANILNERTRETIVEPYVMWDVSGLTICIIGMSDMNIIEDSPDENVLGLDVIPFDEALDSISADIARKNPDVVIAAGRMDGDCIMDMVKKHQFIDIFVTNNFSGGFTGKQGNTTIVSIIGKPVYIASEQEDHINRLTVGYIDGIITREFTDITLGDEFPPDEEIAAGLSKIFEELERKDYEESVAVRDGSAVASILREVIDVDVVFFERDCLFYYPLEDSLTLFDVRKVIKPSRQLTTFSLKGTLLEQVFKQSKSQTNPALRLHSAGITEDGKVDEIPIQEDREYTVLSTPFLRSGGNGYSQFARGVVERVSDVTMLEIVEDYLVAKDERLREAAKKKLWTLNLHLKIGSNLNKLDIDNDKELYGDRVPKPFRDYKDQFTGLFSISSWNNTFLYTKGRRRFFTRLNMKYIRSGYRPEKGHIIYKETGDDLDLYNKFTYDHPGFILKPYIDTTVSSEFYYVSGKHPITASVSMGVTREFPVLLNLVLNVGIAGDRNYFTNVNGMGLKAKMTFDRSYTANKILTKDTTFHSETVIDYKPTARYDMEFSLQNRNDFSIQIWRKFDMTFHFNAYSYRNTKFRKVAVGLYYDFTLNYAMDWNF